MDASIAMIPKADGDSTPLGQRPLSVLPVVYRLWASLRHGHLRDWVEGWLPESVFSSLQSRLDLPLLWTLRRFCPVLVGISCMLWLLMSSSLFTELVGPFLSVLWVDLVCLVGSGWRILLTIVRSLRFKLAAGPGESW